MFSLHRLLFAAALAVAPLSQAHAERLFGLTSINSVVTFDSTDATTITSTGTITGIGAGETLLGLDLRPFNRTLYSLSSAGVLYSITINSKGYFAAAVGTLGPALTGTGFGVDFNPVPDRLRVVSDSNQNLRVNPANAVTLIDGDENYSGNPALDPNIVGVAYTNSRAGATSTMLYGIDALTSSLVRITVPNAGSIQNVGALGFTLLANTRVGFDISGGTGDAFMSRDNKLYALNLSSGHATSLGNIGATGGPAIVGITAASVPEPASWALMIGGFGLVGSAARRRQMATA